MVRYEHLPINKKALDLAIYFEQKIVRNFSRYHKYTLETELREKSRKIVELVIKANSAKDKLLLLLELRESIEGIEGARKDLKGGQDLSQFQFLFA